MNILPKKRWHVRTKENIARVLRDQANAAQEEKDKQSRIQKAEQEARLKVLRDLAAQHRDEHQASTSQSHTREQSAEEEIQNRVTSKSHVNFFEELELGHYESLAPNSDHQREIKEEKEKYEKQIGYLTYLGQDTNEALGKQNWYNVLPSRMKGKDIRQTCDKMVVRDVEGNVKSEDPTYCREKQNSYKQWQDPLTVIKKHLNAKPAGSKEPYKKSSKETIKLDDYRSTLKNVRSYKKKSKHKEKKQKYSSRSDECESKIKKQKYSSSSDEFESKIKKLKALRQKRLEREANERDREKELITRLSGGSKPTSSGPNTNAATHKQMYNSQFNPYLAKQNYSKY